MNYPCWLSGHVLRIVCLLTSINDAAEKQCDLGFTIPCGPKEGAEHYGILASVGGIRSSCDVVGITSLWTMVQLALRYGFRASMEGIKLACVAADEQANGFIGQLDVEETS